MKKKGAISVFVIAGITLIILIALIGLKLRLDAKKQLEQDSKDAKVLASVKPKIESYTEDCLEYLAEEAPKHTWVSDDELIEKYIEEHLMDCMDDFDFIKQEGYDVNYKEYKIGARVTEEKIEVNLSFPFTVVKGGQEAYFDEFEASTEIDYDIVYDPEEDENVIVDMEDVEDYEMIYRNVVFKTEERNDPRPLLIYIVKIDLDDPGIEFLVTPLQPGIQRTSSFLEEHELQVAINGGGWNRDGVDYLPPYHTTADAVGYIYSQGNLVSEGEDFWVTVSITEDNRPFLGVKPDERYNVITGFNLLVKDGEVLERWINPAHDRYEPADEADFRPRTSVGYDEDKNVFIMILVDGDGGGGTLGVNKKELALLHFEHGSEVAINLDGGSSTTLVIEGKGVINQAGNPPVATHLGFWGEAWTLGTQPLIDDVDLGPGDDTDANTPSDVQTGSSDIDNFRVVTAGIAAGAQPSEAGFQYLADLGYKTIIDTSGAEVGWAKDVVEGLGMKYVYAPLGIYNSASSLNGPANAVADELAASSNHPVYVHCQYGAHRTGVSVGLYRVRYGGWSFEDAEAEMLQYAYGNYPYDWHFEVVEMNS